MRRGKKQTLEGRLSIGRQSDDGEGYIRISVRDETSHLEFASVKVPCAEFAEALVGHSSRPCTLDLQGLELVGKALEMKHECVFVPHGPYETREERTRKACDEWGGRGWVAYVGDALNHNNKVSSDDHGDIYKVTYRRWVDKPVGGRDDQDTPGTEHQQ